MRQFETPGYGCETGPGNQRSLTCTDLRAGAAVVLAALAARGESTVTGLSHIERGYAEFVPTLRHLGAEITIAEI